MLIRSPALCRRQWRKVEGRRGRGWRRRARLVAARASLGLSGTRAFLARDLTTGRSFLPAVLFKYHVSRIVDLTFFSTLLYFITSDLFVICL